MLYERCWPNRRQASSHKGAVPVGAGMPAMRAVQPAQSNEWDSSYQANLARAACSFL